MYLLYKKYVHYALIDILHPYSTSFVALFIAYAIQHQGDKQPEGE